MLTEAERRVVEAASLAAPWPLVERFSAMRRESAEELNAAGAEIVARLRALGVPVTVHEPELYLCQPAPSHVEAAGVRYEAKPAPLSCPAPQGLEAPLTFVPDPVFPPQGWSPQTAPLFGEGFDPAPGLPDLRGRIAVYRGMISAERILGFQALGAVGVIAVNPGEDVHWGGGSGAWGTPDLDDLPLKPTIPAAAVNLPAGEALIALAEAGGSARLVCNITEDWHRVLLPVVEIPGTEEADRFVLLHGHYDAWDVGVGDNATGDAAMLEVARVLWAHRGLLRRGVRIAWWPGHSTGRFAGSTWYADHSAHELMRGCVAHVNCDSPGCRWATVYNAIPWMEENADHVRGVVRDLTGLEAMGKRPTQSSDFSFNNIGITGYFSASSRIPPEEIKRLGYYYVMGNGGNIEWHTVRDRMEIADPEVLLRDIRIYLLAVFRNATLPLLPLDFRPLLAEFSATIARYAAAAGDRFSLAPSASAAEALSALLARFHEGIASGAIGTEAANAALLRLMRLLVPLNYTSSGARYRRDPGLPAPPLPALALATELHRYPPRALGFALTQLSRGQNQVVAGLEEASAMLRAVTEALAPRA